MTWLLSEVIQAQGFFEDEPVRIDFGLDPIQALVISDIEFLSALRRMAPDYAHKFHDVERRSSRPFRILGASILVAVLVAAIYVWGIPGASDFAAENVPPEWESKLGEAVAANFADPEGLDDCIEAPVVAYVDLIVGTINNAAVDLYGEHPYELKVRIIKNPMVNALAAPGGHILIFTGLLEETETPEELAGVIAHELQHVLQRHATKSIFQSLSTYMLIALVFGDVSGVSEVVHAMGTMRYSRAIEEEADRLGMELVLGARINPEGMIAFFETLSEVSPDMPDELRYISSHPQTHERIKNLEAQAAASGGGGTGTAGLLPDVDWKKAVKGCGYERPVPVKRGQ